MKNPEEADLSPTEDDDENEDDSSVELSSEFWQTIEERRKEPTIPLDEVREELLREDEDAG